MAMLNLTDAPDDPIERLLWAGGITKAVQRELDALYRDAYFAARMEGRIDTALGLSLHSRKRVLAYTRAANEERGRIVKRWAD